MCTVGAGLALAGYGYQGWQNMKTKQQADDAAREQRDLVTKENQGIQDNVDQANANFGVTTSKKYEAAAKQTKDSLDKQLGAYRNAYFDEGNQELDNQFGKAVSQSRIASARRGLLGSGVDTASQGATLADYLEGKQRLAVGAEQQQRQLQSSLEDQRAAAVREAANGPFASATAGPSLLDTSQALRSARAGVADQGLGDLFKAGAGAVDQRSTARGMGYGSTAPAATTAGGTGAGGGSGIDQGFQVFFGS
jgi:hypothetical protein